MINNNQILTVSTLTSLLKNTLESTYPFVWVKGQVVNLSRPTSGHVYFSLRDDFASLPAVWFKGSQKAEERFDPLTGEVYEDGGRQCLAASLDNGQEVVCAGRLTVYAARGSYQLVVELAQDIGLGKLQAEFERLKEKLRELGYFAAERKRPLPQNPHKVAVITAASGAAIHDFLRIAETRGVGSTVRIYSALMQGAGAAQAIITRLQAVQQEAWAEVIVLIRGGGSLEDLWAFNDESLATAIKDANIPVLAGIGHEVDITLADMTADTRAATPTHAAQILWSERRSFYEALDSFDLALTEAIENIIDGATYKVQTLERQVMAYSPMRRLSSWEERLQAVLFRVNTAALTFFRHHEQTIGDTERVLSSFPATLLAPMAQLTAWQQSMELYRERFLHAASLSLERETLKLDGANPLLPLQRGYALVYDQLDNLVYDAATLHSGDTLRIELHKGSVVASVLHTKKEKP